MFLWFFVAKTTPLFIYFSLKCLKLYSYICQKVSFPKPLKQTSLITVTCHPLYELNINLKMKSKFWLFYSTGFETYWWFFMFYWSCLGVVLFPHWEAALSKLSVSSICKKTKLILLLMWITVYSILYVLRLSIFLTELIKMCAGLSSLMHRPFHKSFSHAQKLLW